MQWLSAEPQDEYLWSEFWGKLPKTDSTLKLQQEKKVAMVKPSKVDKKLVAAKSWKNMSLQLDIIWRQSVAEVYS